MVEINGKKAPQSISFGHSTVLVESCRGNILWEGAYFGWVWFLLESLRMVPEFFLINVSCSKILRCAIFPQQNFCRQHFKSGKVFSPQLLGVKFHKPSYFFQLSENPWPLAPNIVWPFPQTVCHTVHLSGHHLSTICPSAPPPQLLASELLSFSASRQSSSYFASVILAMALEVFVTVSALPPIAVLQHLPLLTLPYQLAHPPSTALLSLRCRATKRRSKRC